LRGDRAPDQDAHAQHPHDLFTTASLLWRIVAGMHTNEATLAPTTPGPSERPDRTGAKLLWYARRRRHARMTTRALAAMPTVADAREAA
jgi:hypothetical protein